MKLQHDFIRKVGNHCSWECGEWSKEDLGCWENCKSAEHVQ